MSLRRLYPAGWAALLLLTVTGARADAPWRRAAPVVDVQSPAVMSALETKGFGFAAVLGAGSASGLQQLHSESSAYRSLADAVASDVRALRQDMKHNGRTLYEVTDQNVGRIIDLRWLQSPLATFRLAGVVNRLDRTDFSALAGERDCGEVRLIYRLAYRFTRGTTTYASRLPVNLNAVFRVAAGEGGACQAAAAAWVPAADVPEAQQAAWLLAGPLGRDRLRLKQIEINAQVVRFPSGMETEFGGQAVYLMRIFEAAGSGSGLALRVRPLENTPDVARLKGDAELRRQLIAYLRENAEAIDRGVFRLPEPFLATKALSFSTYGSARLANHPFTELVREQDLADLPYERMRLARAPKALIERLDTATCMGCHQSNATAGFHFIGFDQPDVSPFNRVKIAVSPHFYAETVRRKAYLAAVAAGRAANRFRPLPAAPPARWENEETAVHESAGLGMPCIPAAAQPSFARTWSCPAAATCQVIGSNRRLAIEMGQCLPPPREEELFSGLPCLSGEITSAAAPYRDTFAIKAQLHSFRLAPGPEGYNCRRPKIGVPGGLSYRQCTDSDKRFAQFRTGTGIPNEICGFAGGRAFDRCVATNNFAQCYGASVVRGNRPTCGRDRFCREDFMCQALPDNMPESGTVARDFGFCSPTYFLFQMRIDNHPDPVVGVR